MNTTKIFSPTILQRYDWKQGILLYTNSISVQIYFVNIFEKRFMPKQTKKYSAAIVFTRMPCEVFIKSPHEVCNFFKLSLSKKGNYLTFFSPLPLFKLSFSYLLPPSSRTTWLKTRQATFWIEAGIALLTLLFLLLRLMPDTGFNITGGTEIPQCIFASQK